MSVQTGIKDYHFASIIDLLLEIQTYRSKGSNKKYLENKFVSISRGKLQKRCNRYKRPLSTLIGRGIIIDTGYSIDNGICKRYKFANLHFSKANLCYFSNKPLFKKISKEKYCVIEDSDYLRKMFSYLKSIEIDPACLDFLKSQSLKTGVHNLHLKMIQSILNKSWLFKESTKVRRIFTNFSILPKQYRKFVSLAGEKELCTIDISNSNWYFFSQLIKNLSKKSNQVAEAFRYLSYFDSASLNSTISPSFDCATSSATFFSDFQFECSLASSFTFTSSVTPSIYVGGFSEATEKFIKHCEQGTLYGDLVRILKPYYKRSPQRDRVKTKALMLISNDFNNEIHLRNIHKLLHGMLDEYPQIIDIVSKLKNTEYSELTINLMKLEVRVMIHQIGKRLVHEDIPLLTIHDCICIPRKYISKVIQIMNEEFYRSFGSIPALKIEDMEGNKILEY